MDKSLTRSDYVFALIFIFMLICAVGAFFYGLETGKQTEKAKYEQTLNTDKEPESTAYSQQSLVSFYHTIYQPSKQFQKTWFDRMNAIALNSSSVDPAAYMEELSKIADKAFGDIRTVNMPAVSPLLQEAQEDYLKSAKLFSDGAKNFRSQIGPKRGEELLQDIDGNASFKQAIEYALQAQQKYYESIVKWNGMLNVTLKDIDFSAEPQIAIDEWQKLNLNQKNNYVAATMENEKYFEPYTPQDVTIRADELIASKQADKMKLTEIRQIIDLLVSTDAVREGDFTKDKGQWYSNEILPQLPFFYQS